MAYDVTFMNNVLLLSNIARISTDATTKIAVLMHLTFKQMKLRLELNNLPPCMFQLMEHD